MNVPGLNDKRVQAAFGAMILLALVIVCAALYRTFPSYSVSIASPHGAVTPNVSPMPDESDKTQELHQLAMQLKSNPGHTPILFRMAQLFLELGKPADAAVHLQEILNREPDNLDARLELGRVLYETGDAAGAIRETKELLSKDPKNVDALYNLGAIYANQNNTALARQYWSQSVASDPKAESGQNSQRGLEKLNGASPHYPSGLDFPSLANRPPSPRK